MALTRLWLGAELRARWRLHLLLALLIGVVGTVVLTAGAGARTTASAYDRFKDRQAIPDVEFDSQQADARAAISHLPGVRSAGAFAAMFMAPGEDLLPGQDFIVFGAADGNYGRVIDRPIVLEGRMPRPDAKDEVAVNESGRAVSKLHVGSQTVLRSMSPDDGKLLNSGHFDEIKFAGPTPTVRVVGVVRTRLDLGQVSYAKNYLVAGPAFYEAYGPGVFYFTEPQLDVRLQRPGQAEKFVAVARAGVQEFPESAEQFNGRAMAPVLAAVRNATRIQALSLGLVALAAAIAGLLGLALMTARSVAGMSDDFPTLRAMGVAKPGRAGLAAATFLPAAGAGVVLALLGATLASPLFPTAVARRLGPSPGISFDAVALLPGALVLVVVVLGSAAFSAYRWRPLPVTQGGLYVGPFDRLAGTLPPSPRIGVRWALPRRDAVAGRGRAAVAGAVIGVIALVAAVTYANGLRHFPAQWDPKLGIHVT